MTAKPKVASDVTLDNSFLGNTIQVCVVTRDYQRTMEGLVQAGIGPWRVYTFGPETVTELTFRGRPASYSMKLCIAFSGSMMWEIVQPLTGPNLYEEFLEEHGEGVHHVAVDCNGLPWEARLAAFEERGFAMVQSGWWQGVVPYAYFETEAATTTTIETFFIPEDFVMPEPEAWYPAAPPSAG